MTREKRKERLRQAFLCLKDYNNVYIPSLRDVWREAKCPMCEQGVCGYYSNCGFKPFPCRAEFYVEGKGWNVRKLKVHIQDAMKSIA